MNGVQVSYSPLLGPVNYTVFPGPHISKWQIQGLIAEGTCPTHPRSAWPVRVWELLGQSGAQRASPPSRESTLSSPLSLQGSRGQALGPSDWDRLSAPTPLATAQEDSREVALGMRHCVNEGMCGRK